MPLDDCCCRWRSARTRRSRTAAWSATRPRAPSSSSRPRVAWTRRLTRERYPRVATLPFDAAYKFMATFHRMTGRRRQGRHPLLRQGCSGPAARPRHVGTGSRRQALPDRPRSASHTSRRTSGSARRACASWRPPSATSTRSTFDPNADLLPLIADLQLLALVGHRRPAAGRGPGRHREGAKRPASRSG